MRIFAAVELPPAIRETIARAASVLAAEPGISAVKAVNIHITLKFYGEARQEDIGRIMESAQSAAKGRRAEAIRIAGFGAFPPKGATRVVWAGVGDGAEFLCGLAKALGNETGGDGSEAPAFIPHATAARIKKPWAANAARRFIETAALDCEQFLPEGISVVKSTLTPEGACYETIRLARFG